MPFTPYHFGPNGLVGLVFKKWLDLPAVLLANVMIDTEVLFRSHNPVPPLTHWDYPHQVFHFHTLLIGGLVGACLGLLLYLFKNPLKKLMLLLKLEYQPTLLKMVISGIIGIWLHVIVDSIYHWDVQMFWPNTKWRPLYNILSQHHTKDICLILLLAAFALYIFYLLKNKTINKTKTALETDNGKENC